MLRVKLYAPIAPPAIACRRSQWRAGQLVYNYCMFYTYVLKSKKDDKLYVGWTIDLKQRFKSHQEGKVVATKNRRPLELIYYEACKNKEKAIQREKYLKSGFGRSYLNNRI